MWSIQPSGRRLLLIRLESPITEAEQAALFHSYFETGEPATGGDAADAGLAVARRIAVAHGGDVSSRSSRK